MLGVDELDTSTPGYFGQCTATKRVYERMDEVEKIKIQDEVQRLKAEGNDPDTCQR
jgi:hypothetical protein